jgi:thiamine-phosphate diphosphorylase
MYKKICITNRHIVAGDFLENIKKIARSDVDMIILREKDLTENEYETLASDVLKICAGQGKLCVLHSFTNAAIRLGHPYIHLTMHDLNALDDNARSFFKMIGVSTHSVDEAKEAERLRASYITASHIFPTDCKAGLAPRGLEFLKEVCASVSIPVYALGGVKPSNAEQCIECGASGVCMMSYYANY